MQPIATVHDYTELIAAIRARVAALTITYETLDDVSGLHSGYSSKLLALPPLKHLGATSLGAVLGTLGLALVVVEDPAALARVRDRLTPRERARQVPRQALHIEFTRRALRRNGRKGGKARLVTMTASARRRVARLAARARWSKVRSGSQAHAGPPTP